MTKIKKHSVFTLHLTAGVFLFSDGEETFTARMGDEVYDYPITRENVKNKARIFHLGK